MQSAARRLAWVLALIGVLAAPRRVCGQTLSVQGDRFAVDGTPRFLTFISYFAAIGAGNVASDLKFLKATGFDGVRIWPNLPVGPQLMNPDGSLSPSGLSRLRSVLDRARDERLVVDVTFTAEHVSGLTSDRFRAAIVAATAALREYENVLFDIQNERNVYGPFGRPLPSADVAAIRDAIKGVHPARIVTASTSGGPAELAAEFASQTGLDVTAYHEPRGANWYTSSQVQSVVDALRANQRPAYLQEPSRYPFPSTDRADFFRAAIANAKLAGAAAWCFHTDLSFDLRGEETFFENVLRSRPEPDWAFVTSLVPRINLQTANGINYVTAEGGGGGAVRADRIVVGPWETFTAIALVGGPLVTGDRVAFRTADAAHYLQAVNGGGAAVRAIGASPGPWETFILDSPADPIVRHGGAIRLRVDDTPWYVVSENGGGGEVNASRVVPGAWETFTLLFVR